MSKYSESAEVAGLIAAAPDPTPLIIGHGVDAAGRTELCAATVDLFVSILAAEAGNLAVKVLATGGVYLAGGVVAHTLAALEQGGKFMPSFTRKGRFADLMARIPVHAIVSHAGLAGAAACGLAD